MLNLFNQKKIIDKIIKNINQEIKSLVILGYLAMVELFGRKSKTNVQLLEKTAIEAMKNIHILIKEHENPEFKNNPLYTAFIKNLQDDFFLPSKDPVEMLSIGSKLIGILPLML